MAMAVAHGGDLGEARRRFPDAPEPFIDLSTGVSPVPYPFTPPRPEAFTRLPEPAALQALQTIAARAYGVADPAMVVASPGTQLIISLLPRVFPQASVAVLGPTYAEHARSWRQAGAEVQTVKDPGAANVLCNPNNPDGARVSSADLLALAERGRLLVIDEAFADFEGAGFGPHLRRPGVVVLRSFGKAFGLAGLRLGFALAMPPTAASIRDALGPWAVGGPAIAIGCEALADAGWLAQAGARLERDAAALDAALAAAGCRVLGGTRLFRLAHAPAGLFERLGQAGIFVRRFDDRPGHLRFSIPRPDQWPRLLAVLGKG